MFRVHVYTLELPNLCRRKSCLDLCWSARGAHFPYPAGSLPRRRIHVPRQQSQIMSPPVKDVGCAQRSHSEGRNWNEAFQELKRKEVGDLDLKGSLSYFSFKSCSIRTGWKWFSSAGCSVACVKHNWQIWPWHCQVFVLPVSKTILAPAV